MFLATCHEISFLHLNAGGLWVHGDGVGVAGRQAMPCNLSTQKRTNRVEDFVEEDFVEFMSSLCWVYVEFTLACSWMTFRPWATVQICRLGQSWISLWISQGFPIDFHKGTIISPRKRVGPCPTDVQESWIERGGAGTPKPVWVWLQPPTLGSRQGGCSGSRDSWRFFNNVTMVSA